jgi:ribosomal protein S30
MKRPFYPGEFTWWLNEQGPAKRKKNKADRLRVNSATYRQRVKIDDGVLVANAESEILAAAQER